MGKSLIEIKIGSRVKHIDDGKIGELVDIKLSPNGVNDPSIVAIFFVKTETGFMSATSNRFQIVEEDEYEELYPGVHLNQLSDGRVKSQEEVKKSFRYASRRYDYMEYLIEDLNKNPKWEVVSITSRQKFESEGYHLIIKIPV